MDTKANLKAAVAGPSVGDTFLADASSSDSLGKVTRYETAMMNNLQKVWRMLRESQEGRVEQASD
jgi:hypothetical protein